ncbi:S1 family peptidase [Actinacidiphila paucisporea]|uniref:Trypsin-like peptidase domain-containing protein n=1 Tax=Actinacidiphila paucisporea TaxID=310782 RepID=A0A1M7QX14_9ACTN|nr:serine protease [Actinacidiphila paucisporea]SHN36245.1 Trypsin-like peptidase domain-containing protein [Actinacidiphila paucisporea]
MIARPGTGTDYWVELSQGRRLGAGFLLTRRFVVTALHCLRGMADDEAELDVALADGTRVPGRVSRQDKEADLALVEISAGYGVAQPVPVAGVARGGERWRGPYRPAANDVELTGWVAGGAVPYDCEGGGRIEALQLTADQHLGDYSGYSGGPVEGVTDRQDPAVVGILLEQSPDRADPTRSANVLFAATIREVMRRFDHFDVGHLVAVLRPAAGGGAEALPPPPSPARRVDTLLGLFQQMAEQAVLDPADVSELRYLALKRVFDGQDRGAGGDPA